MKIPIDDIFFFLWHHFSHKKFFIKSIHKSFKNISHLVYKKRKNLREIKLKRVREGERDVLVPINLGLTDSGGGWSGGCTHGLCFGSNESDETNKSLIL